MRLIFGTIAALGIAIAVPAAPTFAQAQPAITVGMQVTDASGGAVGTVKAIQGDNLLIQTDKHQVLLPKTSFSATAGKLLFGMNQAQLNAEVEKSLAASTASIAVGATVQGTGGAAVGKIDAVDTDSATITLASGQKVKLPKTGLRGNADGTVTIGYTAAELQALVAGASQSASDQPKAE